MFSNNFATAKTTKEEAPKEFLDYLDPKWKGKIVAAYPNDDDAVLFQYDAFLSHINGKLTRIYTDSSRSFRPTVGKPFRSSLPRISNGSEELLLLSPS